MLPLLVLSLSAVVIERGRALLSTGLQMEVLRAPAASQATPPPVLFVHGTFHGAWCWEPWMEQFAAAGVECHAVSLRGTSGSPAEQKSVRISEHVEDLRSLVRDRFHVPPVLVGHSFGGASCLKYLEAGGPASGCVLLCSVPPSGNAPMVGRFLRRSLRQAWAITAGFVLKRAATDAAACRELFFDERTTDAELAAYLPRLEADSRIGLDVGYFTRNLPSKQADAETGRALWLARAPPALVIGAERDAIVDREGVEETARFLGTGAEFFDLPHDCMLCAGRERVAARIVEWVQAL